MNKDTKIKVIMNNPEAMDIMDKYLPGFKTDKRLRMAAIMTVEQILPFLPIPFSAEQKAAMYAELEKIPE
jgi:hypothetical protein